MFKIIKKLDFCYGHRLMDYEGKCAHPHGHNGIVEIELQGERLDSQGMVVDFGEVSSQVGQFLDQEVDHRMLLRRDDPLVPALQQLGEKSFLMDDNPTAENIAKLIYETCQRMGFPVVAVRLWETPDASAEFRPGALAGVKS